MSESIAEFIKKYGKPYDPETDDYDVSPFQKDIDNASKSSAVFGMHMYWTKQDPYVVRQYIEHYTRPGDIVLDAFAGTGMTGVACKMSGRHAILFDLAPVCIHISRNHLNPVEPNELRKSARSLLEELKEPLDKIYVTTCHKCGNKNAEISNIMFSDVLACPRCGNNITYAGEGRWEEMRHGKKIHRLSCSRCGLNFRKGEATYVTSIPVLLRIACTCDAKGTEKERALTEADKCKLDSISKYPGGSWFPKDKSFPPSKILNHLHKRGITHPYQLFSVFSLNALSLIWDKIERVKDEMTREKLKFIFTGCLFKSSLLCKWMPRRVKGKIKPNLIGPEQISKGKLTLPSIASEENVRINFLRRTEIISKGMTLLNSLYSRSNSIVTTKEASACKLDSVQDKSIDYLYYDPPYGSNLMYSVLNAVWEVWLDRMTQCEFDIVEDESVGKTRDWYIGMMEKAFQEAYRVLKPNRWMTLVYSYSDETMYRDIQKIASSVGFVSEGNLVHVNSTRKTRAQQISLKAQQRYLVINFLKPRERKEKYIQISRDIEYDVIRLIQDFLAKHPGKTRDYIYDQVIKQLFSTVQIQKFDLDEILKNFFRKVGDGWYAPGTLVTRKKEKEELQGELFPGPPPLEHPEKEVILQLQDFLKRYKRVPYSELREFYLRKIDIPLERNFDDLIKENFKVEESKVRLPTLVEQERMQDISIQYQIRVIRRFLDGKLDRIPQTEELSNWIEFCYQNEFYKEGAQIYNMLEEDKVEPDRYKKLKKIAEVCRIKSE